MDTTRLTAGSKLKIYFQEVARFGRMADPCYGWAPLGTRPAIPQQRVREYTYAYSAVSPEDGDNFSYILPYADTERMKLFLESFDRYLDGQPALLVMDQAAWHKADILLENCRNIIIRYQPPYSPELNPVENFWAHVREKYFANRYWNSMEELEDHLAEALYDCSKNQETIRSLAAFDWIVSILLIANWYEE